MRGDKATYYNAIEEIETDDYIAYEQDNTYKQHNIGTEYEQEDDLTHAGYPANERAIMPSNEIMAASVSAQIAEFNIAVLPTTYTQTYIHPTTGAGPETLNVQVGITLHETYVSGGRIELPLNFLSPLTFDAGYQNLPFFTPRSDITFPEEVTNWSIEPGALIIDLADGTGSSATFNLTIPFDFNMHFLAKVPAQTTMWDMHASIYIGSELAQTSSFTLIGGESSNISVGGELNIPNNPNFFAGGNVVINYNFIHAWPAF